MNGPLKDYSFGIVPVRRDKDRILYLLIQHRGGHWAFPKGHAEPGETPLESARRELREETGIGDARVEEDRTFVEHYDTVRRGREIDKTVTYFLGWVTDAEVRVQEEEVRDHAWLPYEEAERRITYEETRRILRDAARAAGDSRPGS